MKRVRTTRRRTKKFLRWYVGTKPRLELDCSTEHRCEWNPPQFLISFLLSRVQFEELSKGKDYITEKALRKWDELQELIEADLATQEVIDSYMARIEITNGRVSLQAFKHFMRMLDMVIVDESGNFLTMDDADKAVDIDSLDDDDETDEEEE
jgi:hypothetical protein